MDKADATLQPLPGRGEIPQSAKSVCPADAPVKSFNVAAIDKAIRYNKGMPGVMEVDLERKMVLGNETGKMYVLEAPIHADFALIKAEKGDRWGNLTYRMTARNFGPIMAMAAKVTIVEVDEPILPLGAIDPDDVHCSGIFVQRLIQVPPAPDGLWPTRRQERRR